MGTYLIYLIIILVFLIGLFLLFRELVCWYWKINERIKQQNEIILLLKQLIVKENSKESPTHYLPEKSITRSTDDQLTEEEKIILNNLKNISLKEGEKIILNKTTRKIRKVSKDEWILKFSRDNQWEILEEFK